MTPRDFTYWLQGFAEIHGRAPTADEWRVITDHLQLVFSKETPDRGTSPKDEIKGPFDIDFDKILKREQDRRDNQPGQIPGNPFSPYEVTCSVSPPDVFCSTTEKACYRMG